MLRRKVTLSDDLRSVIVDTRRSQGGDVATGSKRSGRSERSDEDTKFEVMSLKIHGKTFAGQKVAIGPQRQPIGSKFQLEPPDLNL